MNPRGGGTNFNGPLTLAAEVIKTAHINDDDYAQHIIVMYTDGEAAFPTKGCEALKKVSDDEGLSISFYGVREGEENDWVEISQVLLTTLCARASIFQQPCGVAALELSCGVHFSVAVLRLLSNS